MTLAGNKLIPLFSEDVFSKGALKLFQLWASMGYTSIVDLMGAPMGRILKPELCVEMEKQGVLPLRVFYMYTFASLDEIDDALAYAGKSTDMVRFSGLKIFVDGAYAGGMAWTEEENQEGTHGLYYVYPDDTYGKEYNINRIVEKVNDLGLDIHYHVQGDLAVEAVLDALDLAKKNKGFLTSTHTLIHVAFPTEAQIARMKALSPHVVTTVQPAFWEVEEDSDRYYGPKAKGAYPVRQIMEAGVVTGISTDFSVSPLELSPPTTIMNISMTGSGDPANHKPLSMQELLQGLAEGSAATVSSRDTGKLEVGYCADFVVYDQDLYSVPPEKLSKDNPKVVSTWVGGRKVYEAA
jgi:predicted amidohydrolase YtcJ